MSSSGGDSKKKAPASGGIRTLADLNRRSGSYDSGSDSDEHQDYYTGGEKSGMVVRDPSKGNSDVDAIFEKARQVSSTQEPIDDPPPSSSSRSFMGIGRLLSGGVAPAPASAPSQPESFAPVVHNITFWNDGFTVDDGPLRRFDDPQNASFLESIKKSECPKELEPSDRRIAVHVSLSRKEENFPEPVKRLVPFQGTGRTLGSSDSQESSPGPPASAAATSNASSSSPGLSVDPSIPATSIQIRLADGTRMVARFNEHHTIANIRSFIDASRPGATRNYQLQTGFPPKQLTDLSQTIVEAGLSNSVLIQKL